MHAVLEPVECMYAASSARRAHAAASSVERHTSRGLKAAVNISVVRVSRSFCVYVCVRAASYPMLFISFLLVVLSLYKFQECSKLGNLIEFFSISRSRTFVWR